MAAKRVTIKEIATEAGVSPATVSRVLNGKRNVNPEIAERVRKVAEALDYQANEIAQGLARGKLNSLAVVVPDIDNTFFSRICKAIQNSVMEDGTAVLVYNTDGLIEREYGIIKDLAAKLIGGIFLVAPRMPAMEIRALSEDLGVYPVVVDARVENCRVAAVWVDNITAFIEATEHLIALGHRRIGFVAGPSDVATSNDRREGHQIALRTHRIKPQASLICESDFTIQGGYRAAGILMGKRNTPTALLCSNDLMAIGALNYLREQGIDVPGEVAIAGCDDIDVASSLHPTLTTVQQPIHELGAVAAGLMSQYRSTEVIPPNSILHARLIVRNSTTAIKPGGEATETTKG